MCIEFTRLEIDLMRHNADQFTYQRVRGKNMLTLSFLPENC